MSLYDYYGYSIAGMREAQRILDQSAAYLAKPENWYGDSCKVESTPSPYSTFQEYLDNANSDWNGGSSGNGGSGHPGVAVPPGYAPLDDLGVGMGTGPQSIFDAIINALIAVRMYEANARIFAIENKVVGILINIGKE